MSVQAMRESVVGLNPGCSIGAGLVAGPHGVTMVMGMTMLVVLTMMVIVMMMVLTTMMMMMAVSMLSDVVAAVLITMMRPLTVLLCASRSHGAHVSGRSRAVAGGGQAEEAHAGDTRGNESLTHSLPWPLSTTPVN